MLFRRTDEIGLRNFWGYALKIPFKFDFGRHGFRNVLIGLNHASLYFKDILNTRFKYC
jgi:hypothetical protein